MKNETPQYYQGRAYMNDEQKERLKALSVLYQGSVSKTIIEAVENLYRQREGDIEAVNKILK